MHRHACHLYNVIVMTSLDWVGFKCLDLPSIWALKGLFSRKGTYFGLQRALTHPPHLKSEKKLRRLQMQCWRARPNSLSETGNPLSECELWRLETRKSNARLKGNKLASLMSLSVPPPSAASPFDSPLRVCWSLTFVFLLRLLAV